MFRQAFNDAKKFNEAAKKGEELVYAPVVEEEEKEEKSEKKEEEKEAKTEKEEESK